MHIFFSGIGGAGIGPLALIAKQAGYDVSGSDKQESQYTKYLQKNGIDLHIGQTQENIEAINKINPIDWYVYTSAIIFENPNHPELAYVESHSIKYSKRDEFLSYLLNNNHLKLLAVAGTHGKTTTTAMLIWAFKSLNVPLSYSVGAKLSFAEMGEYVKNSHYFAYECDEFDKNFLAFNPYISLITSVDWDHQEIYPTRDSYKQAFRQFIGQSKITVIHPKDKLYLNINDKAIVVSENLVDQIKLPGLQNRQNAALVVSALHKELGTSIDKLINILSKFPGSGRRFEQIKPNLYSDYAHTPEEIQATLQLANELSNNIVVVYEPLTNRRQHYTKDKYKSIFNNIKKLYWLPSYMAREDNNLPILTPEFLISLLDKDVNAVTANKDYELINNITNHLNNGDTVLCLAGGGGGSLDEWIRNEL